MRRRRTIRWSLLAALAGVLVGVAVGTTIASEQVRRLRAQIAQLEQSRARLQTNADQLAAALRDARAPLARRIHELETALAAHGDAPPPDEPGGATAKLAVEASPPSAAPTRHAAAEPAPRDAPAEPPPAAPRAPEPVAQRDAPPPPRSTAPAPPAAVSAAPPPAVSAAPRSAERSCRPLAEPDFALASPDQEVRRLTGDLVRGIEASGPDLIMRLGDGSVHPLVGLPLHVATQCDDLSYIVSICVAQSDPFDVRGVISPAHAWDKPCRALLRSRDRTGL